MTLAPLETISLHGARVHNLKNISVDLPRDKLIVVTGLSGSGKSSLAFDTVYAEGQRRYIESMSLHARQYVEQMEKPDVDLIEGLSPAIAIEQKTSSRSSKSTVGTVTEIYDYLRLLYSRIGVPKCPDHNVPIKGQTPEQILEHIMSSAPDAKIYLYGVYAHGDKGTFEKDFEALRKKGFSRARIDGKEVQLQDVSRLEKNVQHDIEVAVDRLKNNGANKKRLLEALEAAAGLGKGSIFVRIEEGTKVTEKVFSTKAACPICFFSFPPLSPRLFSFNSPYGMCATCDGAGVEVEFSPELLLPDVDESLWDFFGELTDIFPAAVDREAKRIFKKHNTPLNRAVSAYPKALRGELEAKLPELFDDWYDNASADEQTLLDAFLEEKPCSECAGARICREARAVTIHDAPIGELTQLSVSKLIPYLTNWKFSGNEKTIADKIIDEVLARLSFLIDVGLSYVSIDRSTSSLSGGEAQRVRLASQLGSKLSGVLYILDEPSIGLHPRDHRKLLDALRQLQKQGNTVIIVEHDEETIRSADYIVDIGPGAGTAGGRLIFAGPPKNLATADSLTAKYLSGALSSVVNCARSTGTAPEKIKLVGASGHNLRKISVTLPLGKFICVTGVSGSGKSSLVMETLYPALKSATTRRPHASLPYQKLEGADKVGKVMCIDQKPIGRTPRSNPATYTGVFSLIRQFFARVPLANSRGYTASRFSFNVGGGRCEKCHGDGSIRLEMMFMPDVYVPCETCGRRRYNRDTLDILYRGKSIADVLDMTIDDAMAFFENHAQIKQKLQTLVDVGLGYLTLGQGSPSLSGGEAQRLKLARELSKSSRLSTFYILDEPTTGLHFHDVRKLLECLQRLVDLGHTVLVIEHQLDVVRSSDWIVDLGPDCGEKGGDVLFCGPLSDFSRVRKTSATADVLFNTASS